MTDVSQMVAAFRAQNPTATLGKTDKEVANMMLTQAGALTYAEAEALMKAFSGEQESVGDMVNFSQTKTAAPNAPLVKSMQGTATMRSSTKLDADVAEVETLIRQLIAAVQAGENVSSAKNKETLKEIYNGLVDLETNIDAQRNNIITGLQSRIQLILNETADPKDPLTKYMYGDAVPKPKDSNKGWRAGLAAAGAGVLAFVTRGKVKIGAAVLAGAAMMTSCSEENVYNNNTDLDVDVPAPDLSGIETLIQKLIDAVIAGQDANSAENKEIVEALNAIRDRLISLEEKVDENSAQINDMIGRIQSILMEMLTGDKERAVLLNEILKKLEEGNTANLDILNKILTTVEGFKDNQDVFNETATEILNEMLSKLDSMSSADKAFYNKVLEVIQDISNGNAENAEKYIEVLNNIWSAINNGNNISNTQTQILNDILTTITDMKNSAPEFAEQVSEWFNEVITAIKNGTEVNSEGFAAVLDILKSIQSSNNANATAILDTIKAMWEDIAAGNTEILNAIKDLSTSGAANNKELMEFIQGLYDDSQISADERTDKVVDAINSVGQMVAKLENTVQSVGDSILNRLTGIGSQLEALLKAYQEGNATTQDVLSQLRTIINALNEGNGIGNVTNELLTELLAKADEIINQGGEFIDYTEVLNQILDAINSVAAGVNEIKLSMGENNASIVAALEEIINNQNVQTEALNKFAAESTANQQKLIDQGNTIIEQLDKIGADLGQGISTIIEKLKDSDAKLAAELAALVDALGLKMDDNAQDIVNAIEGLEGNLTAIEDAIKNLIQITDDNNLDLTTTNNLIQTIINLLAQQEDPVFDLSEITSMLATTNDLLQQLLDKDTSNDPTAILDALNEMMEILRNLNVGGGSGSGVDLTTTNNLIQTCINQLSLLVQASSTNTDIMASVTNLGTQLTEVISNLQSGNVTTDEINAKLDEIMAAINNLTNSISS